MSKEAAMSMLTGTPVQTSTPAGSPGLVAVETPKAPALDSTAFAALAKKEAQFVKEREQFKRERDETLAEREKLKTLHQRYQQFEENKTKDPVAALKELGFKEADIFNYMAAQDKPEATPQELAAQAAREATEARIKEFEDAQAKKLQDEITARDNGLIQGFKSDINQAIRANPEKFEFCSHYGPIAEDLIYETALAVVKESGGKDPITAEEITEMVENYYEEQDKAMNTLKKRKPQAPDPATPEAKGQPERSRTVTPGFPNEPQQKPTVTKSRTLSNAATASVASTVTRGQESKGQKRERLMAWLASGEKK